ncbi:MBOAT family O-acyltransferase [Candidatus Leptofilum sp.]|uniref:MBOAT family O-acyltransferase n=1 Tax=Candidatus Leptofilum sp. TaxID=3241576 RepID=UPI003B5C1C60
MLFNSGIFLGFFVIVYALYLLLNKHVRWQNVLLLVASYYFYGRWDWRFLSLILISTLVDFYVGRAIGAIPTDSPANRTRRKQLLAVSMIVNLGILGFFKYFNFFAASFTDLLNLAGLQADAITLKIILPVGISFYTFQTMSYTIDIYREKLQPTQSILNFAVFVAFFPQLVAGPIERAVNLLPQVAKPRQMTPEHIHTGVYLIIWGYFKKMVVADNVGLLADSVFNNYTEHEGLTVFLGVLAFALQIYGDFSGYSNIARGLSRLMGFDLMVNFRLPYFALNPTDFWQRWHVSLSSWLRDYLYIPLGGNRHGKWKTYRNLMLTMLLGGLWHGAAWNFVIWGGFHGTILIIYRLLEKRPIHKDPWSGAYNKLLVVGRMVFMFCLTLVGWLIFRSRSVDQISYILSHVSWQTSDFSVKLLQDITFYALPMVLVELCQYATRDLLLLTRLPRIARVLVYALIIAWTLIFGVRESLEFIYFQF